MGEHLAFLYNIIPGVVNIHAQIHPDNPSVSILGDERMGTGTIIDPEGYILTVGYIVLGEESLTVNLPDGRCVSAQVVGHDFETGLAMLKVEAPDLTVVPMGTLADIEPGQKAVIVASANPTKRIASPGFVTKICPFDAYWEYMLDQALLTSSLNSGFGGGPLLNYRGQLIGVVSLNLYEARGNTLAIPVDPFRAVMKEIKQWNRVASRKPRPWIGVQTQVDLRGLMVFGLAQDGPGMSAGLREGDCILACNSQPVTDRREFYTELWKPKAGETVTLKILRGDKILDILVKSVDRGVFYGVSKAVS